MRENHELPSGGTIEDRIPKTPDPKSADEVITKAIETWEIVKGAYKECEDESPTYMQMYAMKGATVLVDEFLTQLKNVQHDLKRILHPHPKMEQKLGIDEDHMIIDKRH